MSYVIYEIESTRFARIMRNGYWQDAEYKTLGAARAGFDRIAKVHDSKPGNAVPFKQLHAIAEKAHFHAKIEKQETKHNLMSGKPFTQPVNTPLCCDPSSETYWSM
jgi:hypothetical protein